MGIYFWIGGEVVQRSHYPREGAEEDALFYGALCVDTRYPFDEPYNRYGKVDRPYSWETVHKDYFPKEFLMHLLLLGVQ